MRSDENPASEPFRESVERGRAMLALAQESSEGREHELARPEQQVTAAIADLLSHLLTVADDELPSCYRGSTAKRYGAALARGGWNALSAYSELDGDAQGRIAARALRALADAFANYLEV